ncbi:uncharacterized protein LAESUDRAFT_815120 [Laetiporus sulphureus 93-53]|uniref:WW domain-containing protein n=1 Tax=Laetiporus sulphureus 93-53 TaxID=1314785 RepID=A0A165CEX7_9APHY|nr:uncharacterized protein LAESUDRAFT_815120 [Laetiporus sulphureus 93-53]KZT02690.1 hypothetical protein LAESUDRAFT_815120 [Laetiporus sulphureus 93-53]
MLRTYIKQATAEGSYLRAKPSHPSKALFSHIPTMHFSTERYVSASALSEFSDMSSGDMGSPERLPPAYCEEGSIQPITAIQNERYDNNEVLQPGSVTVPAGVHSTALPKEHPNIPQGWTQHIHPEGARYYVNSSEFVPIVTDASIVKPEIFQQLFASIENVRILAGNCGFTLPATCELYLHVEEGRQGCRYYLVDHDTQTEFWLQEVQSESLNLPDATSIEHLKHVLSEHYWTHVEYFPHRAVGPRLCQELAEILYHATADQMTSDSSTFPYDAEQCTKFLHLLEAKTADNVYMICTIARIWSSIFRHRFTQFHGEAHARLCRFQQRFVPFAHNGRLIRLCSVLLFGTPHRLSKELELQYIDGVVYHMHWHKFMSSLKKNWLFSSAVSATLLLASVCLRGLAAGTISQILALLSNGTSLGALATSVGLLYFHAAAEDMAADAVAEHLSAIESHSCGFVLTAVTYSLPQALIFWSMLAIALHIVLIAATG